MSAPNDECSARAAHDFYHHVNGHWIARATLRDDQGHCSTWSAMQDATDAQLRRLLDALPRAPAGTPDAQLAALWSSANDVEAIEASGLAPLAPVLAACDDASTDLASALAALHRFGVFALFEPAESIDPFDVDA